MSDYDVKKTLASKVHVSEGTLQAEVAQVEFQKEEPEPLCPEGTYLGLFLHQIVRKDGTYFRPDEFGCFYPKTQEEKDLCEYYVSVGRCAK